MIYVLQLEPDGAQLFAGAFSAAEIEALEALLPDLDDRRPGTRLRHLPGLIETIAPATRIAAQMLGSAARAVRATLFDKSRDRNWALGWHQDRTIAVRERIDVPGFTDWTVKHGIHHFVPPFDLLARMLTARIRLDPVTTDNGPLRIAPGSHRFGCVTEQRIAALGHRIGSDACFADRGDLWLYATPILHASARSVTNARRRVLQILYSADDLSGGLEWLGV